MPQNISSNTAKSSKPGEKKKPRGKPFKKNDPLTGEIDERINRQGVRKFDEVRHVVLNLLNEKIKVGPEGKEQIMSQFEFVMRNWILSGDFQKQNRALEYGVGKVPDEVNIRFDVDEFIRNNISIFTDGQLLRLSKGENPAIILSEILQDVKGGKK